MKRNASFIGLFGALVVLLTLNPLARQPARQPASGNPPLVLPSMSGRDLFEFYCAPCHGRDGKGQGPVAPALKVNPPDLTAIARRNGGAFPRGRVESLVIGEGDRPATAHGTKEMPVWGPIFRALDSRDTMNKVRIANIVGHIESLQLK